jgi:hypothetical protein
MYVCMCVLVIRNLTLTIPLCQLYLHVLQFAAPPATSLCPYTRTIGLFRDTGKSHRVLVQPRKDVS